MNSVLDRAGGLLSESPLSAPVPKLGPLSPVVIWKVGIFCEWIISRSKKATSFQESWRVPSLWLLQVVLRMLAGRGGNVAVIGRKVIW